MPTELSNMRSGINNKVDSRPKYFDSEISRYGWLFNEKYLNGGILEDEDSVFMAAFEATEMYLDCYRSRYEELKNNNGLI